MINMQEETNIVHIYPLGSNQKFDENDANQLVTVLLNITYKSKKDITALNAQKELYKFDQNKNEQTEIKLNTAITRWSEKIRRLGGIPVGLYEVKIPSDTGYFQWIYPQDTIIFYPN